MDTRLVLAFLALDLLLAITPGPDVVYVLSRGVAQGPRVGLLSTAGVCAAYATNTALVAAGLAVLIRSSPVLFDALRYGGAGYLLLVGIRMLRKPAAVAALETSARAGRLRIVAQGFLTGFLNPKGVVLFVTLLPQFVSRSAQLPVPAQLLVLGSIHVTACLTVYGAIGLTAGRIGRRLTERPRAARLIGYLAGTVLCLLGGRLAVQRG
jgi:threonine/homoserine/homoserine lactone efflux protein